MLNQKYQSQSEAIASYDFMDISSGVGYNQFYLLQTYNGYRLSKTAFMSQEIEKRHLFGTTTLTLVATYNYDLGAFVIPTTIQGTGYLDLATESLSNVGAGSQSYITVTLIKLNGSTETSLVTFNTIDWGSSGGTKTHIYEMTIAKTTFQIGESVRLKFQVYMKARTAGGNLDFTFGQDPLNRDGTYLTPSTDTTVLTTSRLLLPFKVEL